MYTLLPEVIFEVFLLDLAFLAKHTYKVLNGIGLNCSALYYKTYRVDTGVVLNIISKAYLKQHWKRQIKCLDAPKLRIVTTESTRVQRTIPVIVKVGTMCTCDL